jgi:hypothetical protein
MDPRFKTRTAGFCLVILTASTLLAQKPVKKAAVPDASAQAEASKLIKEVYGDQWAAAKTAAQKQALAKTLLQKGKDTKKDEAGRFVLFRLSRDIATQANDGETAFRAIDEMDESFQIDPVEMKATVLTKFVGLAKTTEQHKSIAEKAIELLDQALTKDGFAVARQLVTVGLGEAEKAKDGSLSKLISERTAEIEELAKVYEAVKKATATLDETPTDLEANLTVGKYKCFAKGDWDGGLPMLALSNDTELKSLAKQELDGAASSSEQAKLGDGWWSLAEKKDGRAKRQIQGRAAYWYRKALPGLSGLAKDKVEKRLKSSDTQRSGSPSVTSPAKKSAPTIVGKWAWSDGGTAEFRGDGTAKSSNGNPGRWKCLDKKTRKYQVAWSNGAADWMLISSDGAGLTSKNTEGKTFTAQRLPEP